MPGKDGLFIGQRGASRRSAPGRRQPCSFISLGHETRLCAVSSANSLRKGGHGRLVIFNVTEFRHILLSSPDGLRDVIRAVMQEVLEGEMDEVLGAEKC